MTEPARTRSVVTPEAVQLTPDVAGLGSRMIATIIDSLIQVALGVGITFLFLAIPAADFDSPGTLVTVLYALSLFLVIWGYFPLFEGLWKGRTPGKRLQRLRVIQVNGQPLTLGPLLVRNLLRLIDFLPAYYALGALTMLLTSKSQRLGDLAAGTIVIREHPAPAPTPLSLQADESFPGGAVPVDTTRLTEREYGLVRSFLERRSALTSDARSALAAQLARAIRSRVGGGQDWPGSDEAFLEAAFRSYRSRFAPTSSAVPPPPPATAIAHEEAVDPSGYDRE